MDNQQRLILLTRSSNALLFLIPQAARNVREVLRVSIASISDDAPAEEKVLFDRQEAMLGEFYRAIHVMSHDGWEFANERLQKLIAECEEQRANLDREFQDLWMKEFDSRLDEAVLRAAENPRSNEAISTALSGLEPTSSEGGEQNGEQK
jgi:hypothetical protein